MYVCGPTVYNTFTLEMHAVWCFDTIRRYFEYRGYTVHYISNFTDVDDKIIKGAVKQVWIPRPFGQIYRTFLADVQQWASNLLLKTLGLSTIWMRLLTFIQVLIDKGFAYEAAGDVYFRVAKSENYAKFGQQDPG